MSTNQICPVTRHRHPAGVVTLPIVPYHNFKCDCSCGWLCAPRRQRWLPLLTQFLTRLEGFTASDQSQKAAVSGGREQPRHQTSCHSPRDCDSFSSTSGQHLHMETTSKTWWNWMGRWPAVESQNFISRLCLDNRIMRRSCYDVLPD